MFIVMSICLPTNQTIEDFLTAPKTLFHCNHYRRKFKWAASARRKFQWAAREVKRQIFNIKII